MREDLSEILDGMRVVKNDFEVNLMRKSADIAAKAHIQAMKLTKPNKYEYEIEGEILNQFFRKGAPINPRRDYRGICWVPCTTFKKLI